MVDVSFQDFADDIKEESKFGNLKPAYVIGVAVIFLGIVAYVCFNLFLSPSSDGGFSINKSENQSESQEQSENAEGSEQTIFVHVSGHVKKPGLVELNSNDRVATAIEKAGGANEDANLNSINLAKKCEDGEQINVPSLEDANNETSASSQNSSSSATSSTSSSSNGKININTADSAGLQQISGIGPSKAQKIIAYREQNGNFKSVDDLTNVSGIGEKTLASIRDQICV